MFWLHAEAFLRSQLGLILLGNFIKQNVNFSKMIGGYAYCKIYTAGLLICHLYVQNFLWSVTQFLVPLSITTTSYQLRDDVAAVGVTT